MSKSSLISHRLPSGKWLSMHGYDKNEGISIKIASDRHDKTRTYGIKNIDVIKMESNLTLRQVLARDILDIRWVCKTEEIDSPELRQALKNIILLSKEKYGDRLQKKPNVCHLIIDSCTRRSDFGLELYSNNDKSFVWLINTILCCDGLSVGIDPVIENAVATIQSIPPGERIALLINDLCKRDGLSRHDHPIYAELWFTLVANDENRNLLAARLSKLGSGSCVFPYLNSLGGATKKECAMSDMLTDIGRSFRKIPKEIPSPKTVLLSMLDFENSFSTLVDAIYSFEYKFLPNDPYLDRIIERIFLFPPEIRIRALIKDLDNRIWLNSEADIYPWIWRELFDNEEDRRELIKQLPDVNPNSYVFEFLNRLDEGDGIESEVNIRNVLSSVGHLRPPKNNDYPFKKVSIKKIYKLAEDFYGNFSGLMDALIYYSYSGELDFVSDIYGAVESLPLDERSSLLVSDLSSRAINPEFAYGLFDYNCLWLDIVEDSLGVNALIDALVHLDHGLRGGVFNYLRAVSMLEHYRDSDPLSLFRTLDAAEDVIQKKRSG